LYVDEDEGVALVVWYWQVKTEVRDQELIALRIFSPQISQGLVWVWNGLQRWGAGDWTTFEI